MIGNDRLLKQVAVIEHAREVLSNCSANLEHLLIPGSSCCNVYRVEIEVVEVVRDSSNTLGGIRVVLSELHGRLHIDKDFIEVSEGEFSS